ncbi:MULTISPECIES: zinc ribbon domain-containing protein [unclassified Agrococcus]|uniref:zinc ribbon domain-containing protein n=1 Tax=unclassified Agrococcus TaxID=2615065 RepID=UPI0036229E2C
MALTASPEDQRRLLDLQDVDTRIRQFEHKARVLQDDPEIAASDDALVALDRAVLERLGTVDDLQAEVRRIEADVATVEARATRNRERLQQTSDAKTASAMEHEIATLDRRRSDLEDIELEVMERLEAAEGELAAARAAAEDERARRERLAKARDQGLAGVRSELEAARSDRGGVEASIPADLLALYERQRARYGLGASHLTRGISTASGVQLTAAELAEIRGAAPDAVLLCPSSSAILVRTEESGL